MDSDYKVLIVDNNENVLHLLKYALEEQGLQVDCTTSVTDAIHAERHHVYGVILMREAHLQQALEGAGCTTPLLLLVEDRVSIDRLVADIRLLAQCVIA
jgi:DNA-binding NtrC family response regulator